jgi:hypothetical protein
MADLLELFDTARDSTVHCYTQALVSSHVFTSVAW